jgi:hypothetical protein
MLELLPPVSPHLVAWLDTGGHATAGVPCTVTTRCARRAASTGWAAPSALVRRVGQAATPIRPEALGRFQSNTVPGFLNHFLLF